MANKMPANPRNNNKYPEEKENLIYIEYHIVMKNLCYYARKKSELCNQRLFG